MDDTISIILFLAAILVFAAILFAVITLTKRGPSNLDVNKYRSKWLSIEQQLKRDETSTYHLCILNADSLLDQAMKDRGIQGAVMADRMKIMKQKWSNADSIWAAHKLRNKIAHESDVKINYENTRRALMAFKQALKDVGAI